MNVANVLRVISMLVPGSLRLCSSCAFLSLLLLLLLPLLLIRHSSSSDEHRSIVSTMISVDGDDIFQLERRVASRVSFIFNFVFGNERRVFTSLSVIFFSRTDIGRQRLISDEFKKRKLSVRLRCENCRRGKT